MPRVVSVMRLCVQEQHSEEVNLHPGGWFTSAFGAGCPVGHVAGRGWRPRAQLREMVEQAWCHGGEPWREDRQITTMSREEFLMSMGTPTAEGQQADDGMQQRVGQVAGQAGEAVQQAAGQAQEMAQSAAGQATGRLREQLDQRSSRFAEQINEQASDLRTVSQSLREQGKEGPAKAADRVAGYTEKVGNYLREKDTAALLSDVEDLGRHQPAAVGAGALALGFLASRFLKASSSRRFSARAHGDRRPPPPPPLSPSARAGSPPAPVGSAPAPVGSPPAPVSSPPVVPVEPPGGAGVYSPPPVAPPPSTGSTPGV